MKKHCRDCNCILKKEEIKQGACNACVISFVQNDSESIEYDEVVI